MTWSCSYKELSDFNRKHLDVTTLPETSHDIHWTQTNQQAFYMPIKTFPRVKQGKYNIHNSFRESVILRINLTEEVKTSVLKMWRQLWKQLKKTLSRAPTFKGRRKTQWRVPSSQSDLQIKCKPHQNPNKILHRTSKVNSKIVMEVQSPWLPRTMLNGQSHSTNITILLCQHSYILQCNRARKKRQICKKAKIAEEFYRARRSHLIFDKYIKYIYWKMVLFNKWCWKKWISNLLSIPIGEWGSVYISYCTKHKFKINHQL